MASGKKVSVVIADDHPLIREGIKRLIDKTVDISVCGEASNGQEALAAVETLSPDILVLDLQMPVMDGFEVVDALQQSGSKTKIIILSANNDRSIITHLLSQGVWGYCQKEQAPEFLIKGIRRIQQEAQKSTNHRAVKSPFIFGYDPM